MTVRIADSLAYRIQRTARLLRKHFLDLARRGGLDLTPEQWFILNKLSHEDGQSQVELGEAIFADRPNVSRMLNALESSGLVRRGASGDDGRRLVVSLTSQGRKVHDRFAALVPSARERVFEGITAEDVRTVERVLAKLEKNLERDMN